MSQQTNFRVFLTEKPEDPIEPEDWCKTHPDDPTCQEEPVGPVDPEPEEGSEEWCKTHQDNPLCKEEPEEPVTPEEKEEEQEGGGTIVDVPDTGSFNHYDALTTGVSAFSIAFLVLLITTLIYSRIKHQNQKKDKSFVSFKKKNYTALKTLTTLFFFIALGFLATFLKETTFAETRDFLELSIHTDSNLDLSADIINSNDIAYIKGSIVMMQYSDYGYSLYLHDDNPILVNIADESSFLHSITEPGALTDNSFGYTLEDPSTDPNSVTWYPVHAAENRDLLIDINEPVVAGDELDIYLGVRASSLPEGTYETTLNYTAISKTPFIMQDMTSDVCTLMEPGITYSFKDIRDDKYYNIAKLADGKCWMTSDLATEFIVDEESGNKGILNNDNITITEVTQDNTDLNIKETWEPNKSTMTDSNLNDNWWYCEDDETCTGTASFRHDIDTEDSHASSYYYSWYTATLNSVSYNKLWESEDDFVAKDSICPKGWQLPTREQYDRLIEVYGENKDTYISDPINMQNQGYVFYDGIFYNDTSSYHTSTVSSDNGHESAWFGVDEDVYVLYNDPNIYNSVRCVSRLDKAHVIFNKNTNDSVQNMPQSETIVASESGDIEYNLPSIKPSRNGYTFGGWAIEPNAAVEYQPGDFIRFATPNIIFYAIWYKEIDGIETMQQMDTETCINLQQGEQYILKDARDGKQYSISRLADGNCWMTENLKLDLKTDTTFTKDDTDLNSENGKNNGWTPFSDTQIEAGKGWNYCGAAATCDNSSSSVNNHGNYFYSWFAATANSGKFEDKDTSALDSICPKGWYLPSVSEYQKIVDLYGKENLLSGKSPVYFVPTEYTYFSSTPHFVDMLNLWTKNAYLHSGSTSYANHLSVYWSDNSITANDFGTKDSGNSIRCVADIDLPITLTFFADNDGKEVFDTTNTSSKRGKTITITLPDAAHAPIREGYTFIGWSTQEDKTKRNDSYYEPGEQVVLDSDLNIKFYPVWIGTVPKTILGANGNLNFVYDDKIYRPGQEYVDNLEKTTIVAVCQSNEYNINTLKTCKDTEQVKILSANFDDSFREYQPISTASWFSSDEELATITNIANLDASKVTDMSEMFFDTFSLSSLTLPNNFGVNAINMDSLFNSSAVSSLKLPEGFGVQAENMSLMFAGTSLEHLDLPNSFGSNATSMFGMFASAKIEDKLHLPDGFGSNAISMHGMFTGTEIDFDDEGFPDGFGSKATGMSYMFSDHVTPESLIFPDNFGAQVTDISYMFFNNHRSLKTIVFPTGFASNARYMDAIFSNTSIEKIYVDADDDWNKDTIYDSSNMFKNSFELPNYNYKIIDVRAAHVGEKDGVMGYFTDVCEYYGTCQESRNEQQAVQELLKSTPSILPTITTVENNLEDSTIEPTSTNDINQKTKQSAVPKEEKTSPLGATEENANNSIWVIAVIASAISLVCTILFIVYRRKKAQDRN